jgi:hypothetical protein
MFINGTSWAGEGIIKDGDTIRLGDVTLKAILTPGHTRGSTTWVTTVTDRGKRYNVVFPDGTSVNPGYRLVNDPSYPLTYHRIVIFEQAASAMLQPILVSGDNWPFSYGKPEIVRSAGRVLLHVGATESGSGNFNREMLYVWAKDGWRDADVTSWLDDLRHLLPRGLRVAQSRGPAPRAPRRLRCRP